MKKNWLLLLGIIWPIIWLISRSPLIRFGMFPLGVMMFFILCVWLLVRAIRKRGTTRTTFAGLLVFGAAVFLTSLVGSRERESLRQDLPRVSCDTWSSIAPGTHAVGREWRQASFGRMEGTPVSWLDTAVLSLAKTDSEFYISGDHFGGFGVNIDKQCGEKAGAVSTQ